MGDYLKGLYKDKGYSLVDLIVFGVCIASNSYWGAVVFVLWILFISPTARVVITRKTKTDVTEEK